MSLQEEDIKLPRAPAPWDCEGVGYAFLGRAPSVYPNGTYYPGMDEDKSSFRGGMSSILIVRYTNTPVGPYDELIYQPGFFALDKNEKGEGENNKTEETATRITNIYVSTQHSVQEGRRNWGIPKHLADFNWKVINEKETQLTVTCNNTVIFSASLSISSFIPSFPFSSSMLPSWLLELVHRPIAIESETEDKEKYLSTRLSYSSWSKVVYISGEGGDGIHFPKLKDMNHIWKVGVHLTGFKMVFDTPETILK